MIENYIKKNDDHENKLKRSRIELQFMKEKMIRNKRIYLVDHMAELKEGIDINRNRDKHRSIKILT